MGLLRSFGLSSRLGGTSAVALAIFGTVLCNPVQAGIITFDAPGAYGTYPFGINDSKWITGQYSDSAGYPHGFLRIPDGTFATFDLSGATCGTYPHSINRSGVVVGDGTYHSGSYCYGHGFVRTPDGTLTSFDVPDAISTAASSINNGGLITGSYEDSNNLWHGFLRGTDGTFASFDPSGSIDTDAAAINKAGVIAGSYEDSSKVWHGFVRATDGTIIAIDPPNSTATYAVSINDSGAIAGYYGYRGNNYGFVRKATGKIITLDPKSSNQVGVVALNNGGVVTGVVLVRQTYYGFVRAADGTVKKINLKNSLGIWDMGCINDHAASTGSFLDLNESTVHGFLRTP